MLFVFFQFKDTTETRPRGGGSTSNRGGRSGTDRYSGRGGSSQFSSSGIQFFYILKKVDIYLVP